MAKRRKRMLKDAQSFIGTGVTLGVGSYAVGAADVSGAVPQAKVAVGKLATFLPVTGTITGAGWAMSELGRMQPKRRKRKR